MIMSRNILSVLLMVALMTIARGEDSRTNQWQLQVGWVHQWGRGMSVQGPAPAISVSAVDTVLAGRDLVSGTPGPSIPLTGFINRDFNDGFVHNDIFTGDPGLLGTDPERYGMTWNWGANNILNSQYNYDSGNHPTLAFHLDDREAVLGPVGMSGGTSSDQLPTDGVEFKLSRRLCTWTNGNYTADGSNISWTNGATMLDLVLGVALFPRAEQHVARQASAGVNAVDETYTYFDYYGAAVNGGFPPLTFPYTGSMGAYGDPPAGPLIPELPESWSYVMGPLLGTARDRVAIDSSLWHLRGEAGLTLTKEMSARWSIYFSPQFALEFIRMQAVRSETLTYTDVLSGGTTVISSRSDSNQKSTVVPGILLTGGADYLISENWYLGLSLGWEKLARTPQIRVGPSTVRFDLNGFEGSLYLGRHF